jgi:hypothetical protein
LLFFLCFTFLIIFNFRRQYFSFFSSVSFFGKRSYSAYLTGREGGGTGLSADPLHSKESRKGERGVGGVGGGAEGVEEGYLARQFSAHPRAQCLHASALAYLVDRRGGAWGRRDGSDSNGSR